MDNNKPNIDVYIEELYKIKSDDPNRADSIAIRGLEELGMAPGSKTTKALGIDLEWAAVVILCVLIALCVFLTPNGEAASMYIFGLVFFLAGLFIGLHVPVFGLIFLCSHGGVGLSFMLSCLLKFDKEGSFFDFKRIFKNPAFSDGGMPSNLKLYLCAIVAIFATAIVYTILHNLSPRLKENKIHMIIILLLFLIGILLVGLLPKLFPILFS